MLSILRAHDCIPAKINTHMHEITQRDSGKLKKKTCDKNGRFRPQIELVGAGLYVWRVVGFRLDLRGFRWRCSSS